MKHLFIALILALTNLACQSQTNRQQTGLVGGPCEGCEAIHEYGDRVLTAVDTLPDFQKNADKLKISGRVLDKKGNPAGDVIIYMYHTNPQGVYPRKGGETGWGRRHGYIRGWAKTGKDGRYTFYTFRPASYPNTTISQHIHVTIKEPDKNEYYIDDFLFEDDPYLSEREKKSRPNRGGNGIFLPKQKDGILTIERDIILGLNIPNYD